MSSSDTINCPVCHENIPMEYVICPYDGYSLVKQLREKIKTKIKFSEGVGRAIRLLRSPQSNTNIVLDEIVTNSDRKGPLFIIFILAWVFGFQIAPYYNAYYYSTAPLDIGYVFFLGVIGGLVVAIASYLFYIIFWFIASFLIHIASKLLASSTVTGTASFRETQSIVGYALGPYIIGMMILNLLLFFIIPTNSSADFFVFTTNTTLNASYVNGFGTQVASAIGIFYLVFFVGFSIWSVYICGMGIEKLHRIPRNQAFLIPSALIFLILFITYF